MSEFMVRWLQADETWTEWLPLTLGTGADASGACSVTHSQPFTDSRNAVTLRVDIRAPAGDRTRMARKKAGGLKGRCVCQFHHGGTLLVVVPAGIPPAGDHAGRAFWLEKLQAARQEHVQFFEGWLDSLEAFVGDDAALVRLCREHPLSP